MDIVIARNYSCQVKKECLMDRRMYKTAIAASAVYLALAATPGIAATPETKAINGSNASDYDSLLLPWQAAIKHTAGDLTGCGAVVIDEYWVVTAAHCDVDKLDDTVIAGTSFIPQGDFSQLDNKYQFNVTGRFHHTDYNEYPLNHDIALFRVERSLYTVAKPIQVATKEEQKDADTDFDISWVNGADSKANLIASGWGDTVTKGTFPSELQVVKLGGIPDDQCNNTMTDNDSFVCADSNIAGLIKDVCAGDSGGPIIWQNPERIGDIDKGLRVVGVTSNGAPCDKKNSNPDDPYYQLNGQYTQLSNYREWIESTIRAADNNPSFTLSGIATPTFSKDPFVLVEDRPSGSNDTDSSNNSGNNSSPAPSSGSSGGSIPLWGLGLLAMIGYLRRLR